MKKRLNTQGRIALDNEPMDALHGVLGCFKLFIKEIKGGLIPYGFVEAFVAAKGLNNYFFLNDRPILHMAFY